MGAALAGSGKPLVTTSGTLMLAMGGITDRPGTEEDALAGGPRVDAENHVIALAGEGVRSSVVRLPPTVHSSLDLHGFVPTLIGIARDNGVAGYVGDGANRWPAVHTLDAARLYRLALESAPAGTRLHAVADEGVPFRDIAGSIGRHLGVPVEPRAGRALQLPGRVRGARRPRDERRHPRAARLAARRTPGSSRTSTRATTSRSPGCGRPRSSAPRPRAGSTAAASWA